METKKLIQERRAVNFFDKSKAIDEKTLRDIINLAVLAPSAYNLQPWRILIVRSLENKQKLQSLAFNQPKITDASVNLLLIGKKDAWNDDNPAWAEMLKSYGNEEAVKSAKQAASFLYGSSEERKIKFAESNTGLLAMSLMYAAKEFGLDSHPMSGLDFEGIHKEFNLSEFETVVMNIALGYFDTTKSLHPRRPRFEFDEVAKII